MRQNGVRGNSSRECVLACFYLTVNLTWIEYWVITVNYTHTTVQQTGVWWCRSAWAIGLDIFSDAAWLKPFLQILFFPPLRVISDLCWWISISSFQHLWAIFPFSFLTCSSWASSSVTERVDAHSCPPTERCNIQLFTITTADGADGAFTSGNQYFIDHCEMYTVKIQTPNEMNMT